MIQLKSGKLLLQLLLPLVTLLLLSCDHDEDTPTLPGMLPNTWVFGGADSDWGRSVLVTSDGGYVIVGKTASFGAGLDDIYLIRTDASAAIQWDTTFGGSGVDRGYSVVPASDGGYIIAGETSSFGAGNGDVCLIKIDDSGDTVWTRTIGGGDSDWGSSVIATSDGGYAIVGATLSSGAGNGDVYLIKTDVNGDTLWTETYGGTEPDRGESVIETSGGGYVITGRTSSYGAGSSDVYLIKTDDSGDTVWTRTFGGVEVDRGKSVIETSGSGYIIVGQTSSFGAGLDDVYLIRTDSSGDTVWTKTFGGAGADCGESVVETSDGGCIVAGRTSSSGAGLDDVYLLKTDSSGSLVWQRAFGGADSDWGRSVIVTSDGGYAVMGGTFSFGSGSADVYLIKTDANGDL